MAAGRQRTFDKQDALNKAMEAFWRMGYSATSLSDLTRAMGINKPSLYAAFGNKEELFVSAIQHYVDQYGVPHFEKLTLPDTSLKDRLSNYLGSIARMLTNSKLPGGCFVATSTCEAGSHCLPDHAVHTILDINSRSTDAFIHFFRDEQAKDHLSETALPEELADWLLTLQFGLAVMARNGATVERLQQIIKQGLSCF